MKETLREVALLAFSSFYVSKPAAVDNLWRLPANVYGKTFNSFVCSPIDSNDTLVVVVLTFQPKLSVAPSYVSVIYSRSTYGHIP